MAKKPKTMDRAIEAALALASGRAWQDIRLRDIADAADLTLVQMNEAGASKTGILKAFARRVDRDLLKSLDKNPVEGDVHDRLFDILMRRMEMLDGHKAAIRNIISAPADGLSDWASLMATAADNQGWVLAAAGIDDAGPREAIKRHGLVLVSARAMRVWVDDDDPGLARTMAELDRQLRDGAQWLSRLEAPVAMCTAFGNLAKALIARRAASRSGEEASEPGQPAKQS
jgi:AcrR family transcriptional regulator